MPKAILEFNLPEEQAEFDLAVAGGKLSSVLEDIRNAIRSALKHGDLNAGETKAYEAVQTCLFESVNDNEVSHIIY